MAELFIVGAQRSGTTYLYNVLDMHPQVLMAKPVRPEPKYFLDKEKYAKGKDYYESLYFGSRKKEHQYIGEKSTSYIEHKAVADRIRNYYPCARILIILRDPVQRAYSNYRFSVENDIESLSFSDAIKAQYTRLLNTQFNSSVSPYAYKRRGHYMKYMSAYSDIFDRSQIKIIIHEEFISNIQSIFELYSWLGIDESHVPQGYLAKINVSAALDSGSQEFQKVKDELYEVFIESNNELEEYLGRKIDAWRYK